MVEYGELEGETQVWGFGRAARRLVPVTWRARLEYMRGRHKHFFPWGYAMNGQVGRLDTVRQIIYRCNITRIVETGTYRGTTSAWLADFGAPLSTIEFDPKMFEFSRLRLGRFPHVEVLHGDSSIVLGDILPGIAPETRALFYLDAHWEDHLPLRAELEMIFARLRKAVVVIDDFQVPADPSYRFDDYGAGKSLTPEYVRKCRIPTPYLHFPTIPAAEETGALRGWVVVTIDPELSAILAQIPSLSAG